MRAEILINAFLFAFVFFYNGIMGQQCNSLAKRYPGAVVLRAEKKKETPGSTLHGCIELMRDQEMYTAPKLIDSLGNSHRYFGREALAYWYVLNNDTIYYLNSGRNLHLFKWIYLKQIVSGSMELYLFQLQGTTDVLTLSTNVYSYYYLRKNDKWLNEKAIVWNQGGKRKRMQKIFNDCKPALQMISKTASIALDDILPQLVNLYNSSCSVPK